MKQPPTQQDAIKQLYWDLWLSHVRNLGTVARAEWEGLLAMAQALSPVLGMRCATCGKLRRLLWFPRGQHADCASLGPPEADPDLPPFD